MLYISVLQTLWPIKNAFITSEWSPVRAMGYVIILTDSKSGVAEFGFALTFTIHTQTHFVIELFSLRLRSVVKDPINSELEFCGFKSMCISFETIHMLVCLMTKLTFSTIKIYCLSLSEKKGWSFLNDTDFYTIKCSPEWEYQYVLSQTSCFNRKHIHTGKTVLVK